jgi:hypothetical protein
MMAESGWLSWCAIDAVSSPTVETRATCASSPDSGHVRLRNHGAAFRRPERQNLQRPPLWRRSQIRSMIE